MSPELWAAFKAVHKALIKYGGGVEPRSRGRK